jgi:hypothetical protein
VDFFVGSLSIEFGSLPSSHYCPEHNNGDGQCDDESTHSGESIVIGVIEQQQKQGAQIKGSYQGDKGTQQRDGDAS